MSFRIGEIDGFECIRPNISLKDLGSRVVEPVVPVGDRQEDIYEPKSGYDSQNNQYGRFSGGYAGMPPSAIANHVTYGPDAYSRETEHGSYRVNLVA